MEKGKGEMKFTCVKCGATAEFFNAWKADDAGWRLKIINEKEFDICPVCAPPDKYKTKWDRQKMTFGT